MNVEINGAADDVIYLLTKWKFLMTTADGTPSWYQESIHHIIPNILKKIEPIAHLLQAEI